jgi:hypothetical protein
VAVYPPEFEIIDIEMKKISAARGPRFYFVVKDGSYGELSD